MHRLICRNHFSQVFWACRLFFYETIKGWAAAAEFENAGAYMIFGLVGLNFLVEMAVNVLLSVVIVRIINIGKKTLL